MQKYLITSIFLIMNKVKRNRSTKTKEAVEQILQAFSAPISLNDLYQFIKVSLPKTAFSTIFRITNQLESEGKINRIDWRERGSRFEWAAMPHHHHIVCQICHVITDLSDESLNFDDTKIEKVTGYKIKNHSIELEGICPQCLKKLDK